MDASSLKLGLPPGIISDECSMNIVCQKEFYEAFVKKVTDTLAGCVTVDKKDETTMLIKE